MPFDPRKYLVLMMYTIFAILICTYVFGNENGDLSENTYPVENVKVIEILDKIEKIEKDGDKVYYNKITTVEPKDAADQYCYVKVIIKETDNTIIKEEILECADGRKTVDGPSYWQLFAQFYYRDVATPEYCRMYSRPNHAFKSFGKVCLQQNGEWEVK